VQADIKSIGELMGLSDAIIGLTSMSPLMYNDISDASLCYRQLNGRPGS